MEIVTTLALVVVMFFVQYIILTAGWGLVVHSWPVVIGGFIIATLLGAFVELMRRK